jgi:hypothetical protein
MESNPSDTVSATIEPLTSINSNSQIPREYALFQNYPNPFNPETIIEYDLPRASDVLISIYSITGAKVRNLVSGSRQAGHHFVSWNGMDENGKPLASGLYFYVIHAEQFTATKKMILLR